MTDRFKLTPKWDFTNGYAWVLHGDQALHPEATLASAIIEKWALVAAVPDGEDSAGRQKSRLPTPEELANRAADLAAAAFATYQSRGWLQAIPPPDEAERAWVREARQR